MRLTPDAVIRAATVPGPALLLFVLASSCSGVPKPQDPQAALAVAERQLIDGDAAAAASLLDALDEEVFTGRDLERYKLAHATALAATGRHWKGFKVIRDFPEQHPFSDLRADVESLEFRIGEHLIGSDGGFLFFSSDKEDGRAVLEHFLQRAGLLRRDLLADALRLLGEKAFAEGDYDLARQRFTQLRRDHEDSEWVPLALFRMAMSRYHTLVGPEFDYEEMRLARQELRHLLERGIENPQARDEVAAASTRVEQWMGERQLTIAHFYRRVGNRRGEELHLRRAADEFPETTAGKRARTELAALSTRAPESPIGADR